MNTERALLAAAIDDRRAWKVVDKHLDTKDLTEPGRVVLDHIGAYYGRDPAAARVDVETLSGLVLQSVSNPKHKETFKLVMDSLATANVSGVNVAAMLAGAKKEALAAKLSNALASGSGDVVGMMEQYRLLEAAGDLDVEDAHEVQWGPALVSEEEGSGQELIRLYPSSVNDAVAGGVRRGHHIVVFARPDIGKTMFLVNMANGFLRQGLKVLYLLNEEPSEDVKRRIVGRMAQRTAFEVAADLQGSLELARAAGYNNFAIEDLTPGTAREVEELVAQLKPDVLFVDQVRNIQMKEDNIVRQLEKAAAAMRQIGRRHRCVVISATQAGDSASGKPVLDMGDVDSSNTGIPGACDVMIGLGARPDDLIANRRIVSICKNKRSAFHGFFPLRVNLALSQYSTMTETIDL